MTACVLCNQARFRRVYQDACVEVVRCCCCGLARQADYAGSVARLGDAFSSVETYYSQRGMAPSAGTGVTRPDLNDDIRKEIVRTLPQGARILDVGCGMGSFAASLADGGFEVHGIEPNPERAACAADRLGGHVQMAMYGAEHYAPDSFDGLTMIQVFEHVENPRESLAAAAGHLKPGGLLVIDVPSFNNPRVLLYRLTRLNRLGKRDFVPHHSYYYTRKTLRGLASSSGFEVLKIVTGRYAIKFAHRVALKPLLRFVDVIANSFGVGGIVMYAKRNMR